jgi:predicted HTH transcriptional regulator
MSQTILILLLVIILIIAGIKIYYLNKNLKAVSKELADEQKECSTMPAFNQKQVEIKNRNKAKVLELFAKHGKITTGLVANNLGVTTVSAFRYLEELEQEGKIKQNGKFGKLVYYSRIN